MNLIICLIIIITLFIYNVSGLYYVILWILALTNYMFASIHLLSDNTNLVMRIIQLVSLATIIFIIAINIKLLILKLFI